jgi:type IV secretory pathway VirB3-like protein
MVDMKNYSKKVRRSLLQRDLMFGVPAIGLILVVISLVIFVYLFRMYFLIPFVAILYVVMRHLTSKDPWMVDIILDNIQQKDVFIP